MHLNRRRESIVLQATNPADKTCFVLIYVLHSCLSSHWHDPPNHMDLRFLMYWWVFLHSINFSSIYSCNNYISPPINTFDCHTVCLLCTSTSPFFSISSNKPALKILRIICISILKLILWIILTTKYRLI